MSTAFMQKKYTLDGLVSHYLEDLKTLRSLVQTPQDEKKLQMYTQAVNVFKRIGVKDLVQFALSRGRSHPHIQEAFPTLLGNRVTHPAKVDLVYAQLLLAYARAFQQYQSNLKDWILRFILTSRFSPLHTVFQQEIAYVISNTQQKIAQYKQLF
jgi:hypothetical protein